MKSPIAEPVAVGAERSSAAASSTAAQHATDLPPAAILPSFTSLHFLPTPASSPTRGSLPTDRYRSRADLAPDGGGCGRAGEGGARRGMWGGWKRGGEIWGGGECGLNVRQAEAEAAAASSSPLPCFYRDGSHQHTTDTALLRSGLLPSAPRSVRVGLYRGRSLPRGGVDVDTSTSAGHFTGMPLW
jgi:hypothetical protein